jgi:hypothetical protein
MIYSEPAGETERGIITTIDENTSVNCRSDGILDWRLKPNPVLIKPILSCATALVSGY